MGNLQVSLAGGATGHLACGILALPFLSFLINGLWLGRKSRTASGLAATFLMGATLVLAVLLAWQYWTLVLGNPASFPGRTALAWEHTWMTFPLESGGAFSASFGFLLDPISVMMVLVITFISFLVNVYSIGYMHDDKSAGRFFPTLSLFSFSMLGLVVAANLAQTFFFWELVGVSSYLLIGFWYHKPSAVAASKKAFIVTRFADAFFLVGVILVAVQVGSLDFSALNAPAAAESLRNSPWAAWFGVNILTLGTLLIYMGAWGKSAMFPFHVWLPDAMEGPTPVSSLIHSATMVVAGIYLTARLFPLFAAAEYTLRIVEVTGVFTALFAAIIACRQTDLKRILAYSTLSQLGYMMFSLGAGLPAAGGAPDSAAFTASMFHIFTHAFFKCMLFLSAGVIIHAVHSNDIRDTGGLRRILPRTYWATLVGCLALAGVFPFAGFFSKEEILHAAWENGHYIAFFAALATGALTAFYMSRYFFLVFHGPRFSAGRSHQDSHAPASASAHSDGHAADGAAGQSAKEMPSMVWPILILAVPSVIAGFAKNFFIAHVLPMYAVIAENGSEAGSGLPWLSPLATVLAVSSIALGWAWYGRKGRKSILGAEQETGLAKIVANKFYIDEGYRFLVRNVGNRLVAAPITWFERTVVNGAFDAVTAVIRGAAWVQSMVQSGQVQAYIGIALVGLLILARWGGLGL